MNKFGFSGEDLISRWQIRDFELLNWIKKGLQPYNENGLKIVYPFSRFGRKTIASFKNKPSFSNLKKDLPESILRSDSDFEFRQYLTAYGYAGLLNANSCVADLFDIPTDRKRAAELINRMKRWLFKTIDVENFEKEHSLFKKSMIFPCAPGTKWEEIKITLTDNETVRIKTPQGEGAFSYHKLNMVDRRSGNKPTILWALIKRFAKNHGFIGRENPVYDNRLPSTAKRLNKHMQDLFEIEDSIYIGHYKRTMGYKTKIFFSDQTQVFTKHA